MKQLPRLKWKRNSVLETKVSLLQGEVRQLKWAVFGAFSECAQLRAVLDQHGIVAPRTTKRGDWSREEARELFALAWKYLWSSEALFIDLHVLTVVTIDNLRMTEDGFRFTLRHVPVAGLSEPKRKAWAESASWERFSCTAWSWTAAFGGWTVDFDPRSIQAARAAAKTVDTTLADRERLKELRYAMEEWRQIIAEQSIVIERGDTVI